ncbi:MAG TPA: hypothetical protein VFX98_15145 [Longimicrobiaceae bacterium]|nr:hypothetical protein [Longimicrobiaceae bacterium]
MPVSFSRQLSWGVASLALALTLYAGLDALAAAALPDTLSACGTEESPCALAPLTVQADRAEAEG